MKSTLKFRSSKATKLSNFLYPNSPESSMTMTSRDKVLKDLFLLREIIWELHGHCRKCHELSEFDEFIHENFKHSSCKRDHIKSLSTCIIVSKLWSDVAIPQLWGYYTRIQELICLMADYPHALSSKPWSDRNNKEVNITLLESLEQL